MKSNFLFNFVCLSILCSFFIFQSNLVYSQTCTSSTFTWDDGNGNGQIFPADSQSESYSLNAGGSLGVTLEIIDPLNRNADFDSHDVASHPYDPTGGCTQIREQFGNQCTGEGDNINPDGTIGDPWDGDCDRDLTQTNGAYGTDYMTVLVYAANSDEEVEYRFTFDRPVEIVDFRISDIDAQGHEGPFGCVENRLGTSYQDEIRVAATDLCGDNVLLNIESSTDQPASQLIVDPVTQSAYSEYNPDQDNNLAPNDQDGEVTVSSTKPVTTFSFFYSNGPDDQAWEENNAAVYAWWSAANGATSGVSDDQAIRVDAFNFCACPVFNIAASANEPPCEGEAVTYTVTSDFTATRLIVDGVDQPATDSFTVASASAASYEIIVETANGCKDSFTFDAVLAPAEECDPCPPVNCINQFGEFTIIKNTP